MRIGMVSLVVAMMLGVTACATTVPEPAPSVDVSGNWAGTWWAHEGSGGAGTLSGLFLQDGRSVRGDFTVMGATTNRTAVSGSIAGNVISLSVPTSGTLSVTGDEITGVVNGLLPTTLKLQRQR